MRRIAIIIFRVNQQTSFTLGAKKSKSIQNFVRKIETILLKLLLISGNRR